MNSWNQRREVLPPESGVYLVVNEEGEEYEDLYSRVNGEFFTKCVTKWKKIN